jgi:hypothetical protein
VYDLVKQYIYHTYLSTLSNKRLSEKMNNTMVEPFAAPASRVAWAFAIETKPSPNHLWDGFVECPVEGFF